MSISTTSSRIAIARVIAVLALIVWFTAALRASYLGLANEPQFVLWSFIAIPILRDVRGQPPQPRADMSNANIAYGIGGGSGRWGSRLMILRRVFVLCSGA